MDLEKLPGLSLEADLAFRAAREMQVIGLSARESQLRAQESIVPLADFAKAMIEGGTADRTREERSNLVKVGVNGVGESVYVFAYTNNPASNARPKDYGFATCIGMDLDSDDYAKLDDTSKDQLDLIGKSAQGKDLYGVIVDTEPLLNIICGYSELDSYESIETREAESISELNDIKRTVEYVKSGLLSNEMNPDGATNFHELVTKIEDERGTVRTELKIDIWE